jgi:hypothetical protein
MHQGARCARLRVRMEARRRAVLSETSGQLRQVFPSPGRSPIRPPAAAVKALRCAPTAGAAHGERAALTASSPAQKSNYPGEGKKNNGRLLQKTLDAAATWRTILWRCTPEFNMQGLEFQYPRGILHFR